MFLSRVRATSVRAFTVYVLPMLEYASGAWSPHYLTDVSRVESVQRRFTKRLPGLAELDCFSRLAILDLDSLELRRLRHDLILAYKIIFGHLDVDASLFFTVRSDCVTRGHEYRLIASNHRIDARKWFFSHRIVDVWNSLPATAKCFNTLSCFERFLNNIDLSKFLQLS